MTSCPVPATDTLPGQLPCVLLVEDDPVSRAFMAAAIAAMPARVDPAACMADGLALGSIRTYDLWLFDAQLPDGSGEELLRRLRRRHRNAAAVAHTACREPATRATLLAAGFAQVLVKPIAGPCLRAELRRWLPSPSRLPSSSGVAEGPGHDYGDAPLPVWDDAAAKRSLGGSHAHVAAMRALFLAELPQARETVLAALARTDPAAADAQLHRLLASCGFVGASRLAAAVRGLQQRLEDPAQAVAFDRAAMATARRNPAAAAPD